MSPRLLAPLLLSAIHCAPARPTTQAPCPPAATPAVASPAPPATAPAGAAPDAEAAVDLIRPCPHDSEAAQQALAAIDALGARIDALDPDADARPLAAELSQLLRDTKCLRILTTEVRPLKFTVGESMRGFWKGGGYAWLTHALQFDAPEPDGHYAWIPPTPRRILTRETEPDHPLASLLLCSRSDTACGAETEPWRRRAETFFTLFDELKAANDGLRNGAVDTDTCEANALTLPAHERYKAWRACIEAGTPPHSTLPLGRFKAPQDGWLVLRGRRGHHGFCDEVRAYDLATGAAYVARSCSGLALTDDGGVDGAKTDAARKDTTQVGRVRLDALREAAWMIVLVGEVEKNVRTYGFGRHVPEEIDIVLPDEFTLSGLNIGFTGSSGQTSLAWNWSRSGTSVAAGTLTWPNDYNDAAREHAVRLLEIAETGLVLGCAPARLPDPRTLAGKPPGVSKLDASPTAVRRVQDDLIAALSGLRRAPLCRGAR